MLPSPLLTLLLAAMPQASPAQALPIHPTNTIELSSGKVGTAKDDFAGYCSVFPTADRSSVILGILNNAAAYPKTVRVKARGCYRAACFGTSGVYVCNKDDRYDYQVPVASLFEDARDILGNCCSASLPPHYAVSGQLFYGKLNTIVATANCLDDPTKPPSEYDGLPGNGFCM